MPGSPGVLLPGDLAPGFCESAIVGLCGHTRCTFVKSRPQQPQQAPLLLCQPVPLLSSSGFFDCGRAVRCMLPLGAGRFMHLVVLYGYQGADADAEQLALTEQLFDAALGELGVVARRQPCMLVGDFNVEPSRIFCLGKGISAVLWVDLKPSWALAYGGKPTPTCQAFLEFPLWSSEGLHGWLPSCCWCCSFL